MTNRLELNWKIDGFVDEQRYYCSEAPIDIENSPIAKAVLNGDIRSYTDMLIDASKIYYVRISSYRNGSEKFSDEIVVNTSVDLPRNIAIVTNNLTTSYLKSVKSMFESWGHTATIIAESSLTINDARNYDLLVGIRTNENASNVILNAFNEGIPILCSNYAGTAVNTTTWPIKLRLLGQMATSNSSDNNMYRFEDYANIFSKAGVLLPDGSPPYITPNYSTYSIGALASGAHVLAHRTLESGNPSIVIAEKGRLNIDNQPFPSKIAYVGILFTGLTENSKNTIKEMVKWLTR